jgi:signal transduction histidine kinase
MTLRELTRRTAFRTAVTFATLFLILATVIFAILYYRITKGIEHRLRADLTVEQNTLQTLGKDSGVESLKSIIEGKKPPTPDDEEIYLLTDLDGKFLAGNIQALPHFNGWRQLSWDDVTFKSAADAYYGSDTLIASWVPVNGGFLLVGNGDSDIQEIQDLFLDGLLGGLVFALCTALLGGTWLGRQTQHRIDSQQTALDAVSRGDLSARIPLSSSGDDLDHVAGQMNATLDHLQNAVVTLGQVSTDIAHDLKTPIGRISQKLNTVRRSASSVDDYRTTVDDVRGEIDGVIATFESLLRIAQIEGGARKARFTKINLEDVLSKVVDAYEYVAEDAQQNLTAGFSGTTRMTVKGDRDLLVQLFANLIENAIRHCPPGAQIKAGLRTDRGKVVATVSDNGPGIPAEEREKVFRRLYRRESSRTTPGNGLGLSMVAAIAKLHDAQIELSDNAPGLRVELRFPTLNSTTAKNA